jgi:hypothetical protein
VIREILLFQTSALEKMETISEAPWSSLLVQVLDTFPATSLSEALARHETFDKLAFAGDTGEGKTHLLDCLCKISRMDSNKYPKRTEIDPMKSVGAMFARDYSEQINRQEGNNVLQVEYVLADPGDRAAMIEYLNQEPDEGVTGGPLNYQVLKEEWDPTKPFLLPQGSKVGSTSAAATTVMGSPSCEVVIVMFTEQEKRELWAKYKRIDRDCTKEDKVFNELILQEARLALGCGKNSSSEEANIAGARASQLLLAAQGDPDAIDMSSLGDFKDALGKVLVLTMPGH